MRMDGYLERNVKLEYPILIDGEKYEEIIIREFGGKDELELSKNKEAKSSTLSALIFGVTRCIAEVVGAKRLPTEKEIGFLPYGELERIAVALRELTLGEVFKTLGSCPDCGKAVEMTVESPDFLVNTQPDYKSITVPLRTGLLKNGKSLKNAVLRPFNGYSMMCLNYIMDESESQSDKNNELLFTLVESIDDEAITQEDIVSLTKMDRQKIAENITIPKIVKPSLDYTCGYCGVDFQVGVWLFDFLY